MGSSSDRNLLFGIIALQNQLITREQLIAGMQAWTFEQQVSLGEHLVRTGALQSDQRQRMELLLQANLRLHDDDPRQSLAEVSSIASSLEGELTALGNAEITATLDHAGRSGMSQLSLSWDPASGPVRANPESNALRFRILRPHAHGGLGTVSVAEDQELHREVALKEIHDDKAHHQELRTRFIREAEITGGLEHPGIVPIYGLGSYPDGRPFYAMRFIRGDSLDKAIRRYHEALTNPEIKLTASERNLRLRRLLQRFIDVCEAIDYAHSRGVLHRDLKPGNIMLGRYGETLVVDWGLAKLLGEKPESTTPAPTSESLEFSIMDSLGPMAASDEARSSDLTQDGTAVGTLPYMSPEQAQGRLDLLGPASDIFSLGATLYELLTNRAPYQGKRRDVLEAAKNANIPNPRTFNSRLSKNLSAICMKALAKNQADRYPTAKALAHDIEAYLADEPTTAKRETLWERAGRLVRRHRGAFLAGSAALLVLTIGSIAAALVINDAKGRENAANLDKLAALERESKSKELTLLVRTLESSLDLNPWPDGHREKLVKLQKEIAAADPEIGAESNARIDRRFSELIETELRNPKLTAEDYDRLQAELRWLKDRQATGFAALESKFLARRQQWTRVLALSHEPSNAAEIFGQNRVRVDPQARVFPAQGTKQAAIPLLRAGAKNLQLQAEFGPEWENTTQIGFVFASGQNGNYQFLLVPATTTSDAKDLNFKAVRESDGNFLAILQRDKHVLYREIVPASQLKSGLLQLLARREGDNLVFQINDLPLVKTLDLFPLLAQASELALLWPPQVPLHNLTLSEKPQTTEQNDFEKADELYREKNYLGALALYSELGTSLENADARREAQLKAGLCHFSQKQYDDASKLFEALAAEPGERWPVIASCLVWLTRLEQNRREEADVIGQQIITRFEQKRLAEGIPGEFRNKLKEYYFHEINSGRNRLIFRKDIVQSLELYLTIDRVLSLDGKLSNRAYDLAMKIYLDAGNLPRALQLGFDAYKLPGHPFAWRYLRLIHLSGDEAEFHKVLREEKQNPLNSPGKSLLLLAEETRYLWATKGLEQAQASYREFEIKLAQEISGSFYMQGINAHDYFECYILAGLYKNFMGEKVAANKYWQRGLELQLKETFRRKNDPTSDVHLQGVLNAFVFAALLDDVENPELDKVTELIIGAGNKYTQVFGQFASNAEIKKLVIAALQSERGRKLILEHVLNKNLPSASKISLIQLMGWQYLKTKLFRSEMGPETELIVWEFMGKFSAAVMFEEKISLTQLAIAAAAWKGISGFLGWGSFYPSLPNDLKPGFAYIYAHRLLQLKKQPEAIAVYEQLLKDSQPDTDVHRLATKELAALKPSESKSE